MFQLGNLALSIQGMTESGAPSSMGSEGDEEAPVFKKKGEEGEEEDGDGVPEDSAPAEDLFSEIHLGQLKKLEKQLESSESEKQNLSVNAKEMQTTLEKAIKEAAQQKSMVAELMVYLAGLDKLTADENARLSAVEMSQVKDVTGVLEKHRTWQSVCVSELESIKSNLKNFKLEDKTTYDSVLRLKNDLAEQRHQMQVQEKNLIDLNHDIKIMDSLAIESQTALGQVQNELSNVTEELAKIYHHICTANNITPSRVMLEHSKGKTSEICK